MTPTHRAKLIFRSIAIAVAVAGSLAIAGAAQAPTPPVLVAMKEELDRSMAAMSNGDPAAYFRHEERGSRTFPFNIRRQLGKAAHGRRAAPETAAGTFECALLACG